eukprot:4329035-Amphidinium_carterae.1
MQFQHHAAWMLLHSPGMQFVEDHVKTGVRHRLGLALLASRARCMTNIATPQHITISWAKLSKDARRTCLEEQVLPIPSRPKLAPPNINMGVPF